MTFFRNLVRFTTATALISIFSLSTAFADTKAITNGDNVNIRAEGSTSAEILGTYGRGQEVSVIGSDGEWFKIRYDGNDAYISSQWITIAEVDSTVNASSVNVRSSASTDSQILGKVTTGDKLGVTGRAGNFYAVNFNGQNAYVHQDFVDGDLLSFVPTVSSGGEAQSIYAVVSSPTGLKLRESGSTDATVISLLPTGEAMDVLEIGDQWIRVKSDNGETGYVSAEFISIHTGVKPKNTVSTLSSQVISYAKQFLGTPYSWGGTNLKKGVDCSGFVYSVMRNFNVYLNRSSRDMAKNGSSVSKSDLRAGDLVFFDTSGSNNGAISHVGIYMGNGQFIHSSSSKRTWGVTINSLSEDYYVRTYVKASRVLQ